MALTVMDLTGRWEFKEYPVSARRMRDLDEGGWHETDVPCSIFNSLIQAGQISQTDIDSNPENFGWVSEKPWVYRKNFDVAEELLNSDRVYLVFDGLDTIASIWLNEKLVGRADNMFIGLSFDVTKLIKAKNNRLLVKFDSAVQHSKRLAGRYTSFDEASIISPHRAYIRKAQYQFGWDWCPELPGCGVWRAVRLEGINKAAIADVHVRTVDCNSSRADVRVAVKLNKLEDEGLLCKVSLSDRRQSISQELVFDKGQDYQSTVLGIDNPSLWWPNGYGQQNLYNFEIQLFDKDELIDKTQKKTGIRVVKLDRSSDEHGDKFEFQVNGQPVYARGANWIPSSVLAGSVKESDYECLLGAAAKANMNMLRVWGGGYYESDKFYELCDELGIMVWQDFMFACSYYPERKWFLEQIRHEATFVIRRLRNHCCLSLWCGNNEIDWMHYTGKLGKGKKFHGKSIYHRILPEMVAQLDPDRQYIPTTPLSKEDTGFANNQLITTHRWDVWSGHQPVAQYQSPEDGIPKFVTEFGLQSLPCIETIRQFCPKEQLKPGSFSLEKHNYQSEGNSRLYRYTGDLFGTAGNLEQFIYFSQITQARALKSYVEYLRANNHINRGALFWQLNDCCGAISWSAIDGMTRPKALLYYARRFFAEVLVTAVPEFESRTANSPLKVKSLNAVVVNDSSEPITATLRCMVIDTAGNTVDEIKSPIAIGPLCVSRPLKLPKGLVRTAEPEKCFLYLLVEKDGKKIAENLLPYLPDKYIRWPVTPIKTRLKRLNHNKWNLKLSADAIKKDVYISTRAEANFSDNFIDLIPPGGPEITIDYEQHISGGDITIKAL